MEEMGIIMGRKSAGWMLWLFLLGTGCLLVLFWRQNQLLEKLGDMASACLLETGFRGSDTVEFIREGEDGPGEGWAQKAIPLLTYLEGEHGQTEERSDGGIEALALLYPGKKSTSVFWSGAASEKVMGSRLFLAQGEDGASEGLTSPEGEEETLEASVTGGETVDSEISSQMEAAALAENEAFREDHKETGSKGEKQREMKEEALPDSKVRLSSNIKKIKQLQSTQSLSYLLKNFYIVDSTTSIDKRVFDVEMLLNTRLSVKKSNHPQILIFHTHGASERFIDSDPGDISESIVGIGDVLTEVLEKKYGYKVVHDRTEYDKINGRIDRNKAYNKAYRGLKAMLKRYPSIEVVIDLHRDGVGNKVHRLTTIDGKKTAQVMFFNGLSRNRRGNIKYLNNDNLQSNLAFSLQMKMKSMQLYSDFSKPVYLKGYRYNLHMRKRSLLIELGNENNTVQEAKNAMEPLARVLHEVLSEN